MYVDAEAQTIVCKIVYYGPGLSGKTSNFQYLKEHAAIQSGQLVSTDVDAERMLHFQFVRNDLPEFKNYRLIFDFHTIPGQSYYIDSRLKLLDGADGIVFVVDSRREAMDENIDSMNDLYGNLRKQEIANDIPLVVQFNKQDLPSALPVPQLDPLLNSTMKQSFASSASTGQGIIETMQHITNEVVQYIEAQGLGSSGNYAAINTQDSPLSAQSSLTPVKQSSLNQSPVTASITQNQYWLLTCYACESILEVPTANPGDLFACGTCQQTLQVVDPEHGITGPPPASPSIPAAITVNETKVSPAGTQQKIEESSYSMAALPPSPSENSEYEIPTLPAGALSSGADATQDNPLPNILEQYITLNELDRSLLGQRYMLQDKNTGIRVRALVISQEAYRQPAFQTTLENQVRYASQIKHQNVCGFIGMQYYNQQPVILTQNTEDCESLAAIIERRKKLNPPQAIDIAHKIALGLEAASRGNMCHGWIRPECILIGSNGTVIIDDLAIPKQHNYLVRESRGRSAATEYYLAPEHGSSEIQSDERSDIFLLGLLLFKMLTGQGLIVGFNAHEAMHKIKNSGCRSLRSVETSLSRDLDSVCSQMTEVERKDRIQTMRELVDTLAKFGGGAKRHTLRATRAHSHTHARKNEQGSRHTGTVRRTQDGTGRTTHSGNIEGTRSIGAGKVRTAHGPNTYHEDNTRRPKKTSSAFIILIVFLVILGAGALYAWKVIQEQGQAKDNQQEVPRESVASTPAYTENTKHQAPIAEKKAPKAQAKLWTRINDMLSDYKEAPSDEKGLEIARAMRELKKKKNSKIYIQLQNKFNSIREQHSDQKTQTNSNKKDNSASSIANISQAITYEKFEEARQEARKISDDRQKTSQLKRINDSHKQIKTALQLSVNSSYDVDEIDTLLRKALTTWGSAEDKKWAQNLKALGRKRIAAKKEKDLQEKSLTNVEKDLAQEKPIVHTEIRLPTSINDVNFQSLLIGSDINSQLKVHNYNEANNSCNLLPGSYQEHQALSLMIQLHQQSIKEMSQAFKERNIKFRIKGPFEDKVKWSLISFTKESLQLRSPQGSQASMKWKNVDPGTIGNLYNIIANHADGTGKDSAMAVIAYLIDHDLGRAKLATSKARKAQYKNHKQLSLLIAINKHAPTAFICDALVEAVKSKNKKKIRKELAALKKSPDANDKNILSLISLAEPDTKSTTEIDNTHTHAKKNTLDFSDPNDLFAFDMRIGSWTVTDGQLHSNSSGSQIERNDLQQAKSVSFDITFIDQTGAITVEFRGVQLLIELDKQEFNLAHGEQKNIHKGFPFIAQLPYTITMKAEVDNTMRVSINQTAEQSIHMNPNSGKFGFDIEGNKKLTLDNIVIERDLSLILPKVDVEKQQLIKAALGWDPVGGAELHVPQIIIPPWPGKRSAIVRTLTKNNKGVSFEVKGSGDLFITLGDRDSGNVEGLKIPMPLDMEAILFINISWTSSSLRIETREGVNGNSQVDTINNITVPLKHLSIESSRRITILKPPQLK